MYLSQCISQNVFLKCISQNVFLKMYYSGLHIRQGCHQKSFIICSPMDNGGHRYRQGLAASEKAKRRQKEGDVFMVEMLKMF